MSREGTKGKHLTLEERINILKKPYTKYMILKK